MGYGAAVFLQLAERCRRLIPIIPQRGDDAKTLNILGTHVLSAEFGNVVVVEHCNISVRFLLAHFNRD